MSSWWVHILLQPVLSQGFIFSIQQLSNELAGIESFLCGSFSQSLVIILIADCFWSKNLFCRIFLLPGDREDHIAGFVWVKIVKELCDRFFWLFLSRECEMWFRSLTAPWRWWWRWWWLWWWWWWWGRYWWWWWRWSTLRCPPTRLMSSVSTIIHKQLSIHKIGRSKKITNYFQ